MSIKVGKFAVDKLVHKVPPDSKVDVNQSMRARFKEAEIATITYRFSDENDMWLVENGTPVKEIHRTLKVSKTGTPVDETLTFRRGKGDQRDSYHLFQHVVDEGDRKTKKRVVLAIASKA